MLLMEYDIDHSPVRHLPSPGKCIYCRKTGVKLNHEHVVPYAIGQNATILDKACCTICQKIIQPYEQHVLKKQLGIFRAMVEAPTRRKKDRPKTVKLPFLEVDGIGTPIRDLGSREIHLKDAPLILNLWQSPPPRFLGLKIESTNAEGRPWTFVERRVADPIIIRVAQETGSTYVAMKLGEVSRLAYLRSLAKTAHAYVSAEMGVDAFEPFLTELILNKTDDVGEFVGDLKDVSTLEGKTEHSFKIALGEIPEDAGVGKGIIMVFMQLWADLNTPPHVIVVGRTLIDMQAYFQART